LIAAQAQETGCCVCNIGANFIVLVAHSSLPSALDSSSMYSNRAGMRKRLTELGFMAGAYDTRKCKVAGHHPKPNVDVEDAHCIHCADASVLNAEIRSTLTAGFSQKKHEVQQSVEINCKHCYVRWTTLGHYVTPMTQKAAIPHDVIRWFRI
jgi:hypothetical protein